MWDGANDRYELVTSPAVIDELQRGPETKRDDWLGMIAALQLLPVVPAVSDSVAVYMKHHIMPADPGGDALQLAIASFHECDFLVTWNCRHLANANKFGHIRRIDVMPGLFIPAPDTPLEHLGGSNAD